MVVHINMTNVFKYDFAPTRAPPINLPVLNLPGSFGDLAFQAGTLIDWGLNNWMDILILGFAAYGGIVLIPRIINVSKSWLGKTSRSIFK
jgi:hypothetical protein